jgi:hypothetical protein
LHILLHPLAPQLRINFKQESHLQLIVMPHQLNVLRWRQLFKVILRKDF